MGLFDKLRRAKNFLTGGGVELYFEASTEAYKRGETATITVIADVKDADVSVSKVYFKIRARETVRVRERNSSTARTTTAHGDAASRLRAGSTSGTSTTATTGNANQTHTQTETTFNHELVLAGSSALAANSSHEWEASFEIPAECLPTYRGVNADHVWEVYAGLDMRGNDPDTNWQKIEVC